MPSTPSLVLPTTKPCKHSRKRLPCGAVLQLVWQIKVYIKFCFLHNLSRNSGCSSPCPKGIAHACEFCGDAKHTTVRCRLKPKGFVHPFKAR